MDRRAFGLSAACSLSAVGLGAAMSAQARSLTDLSNSEASLGLRTALERGAVAAVGLLARPDGFLANPQVHIPLPGFLADAAKFLRAVGRGKQVEELEIAMNRAAEAAVPLARDLLVKAVKSMTVGDAKSILTGGETSVTAFFAEKTRTPLTERFLPVVVKATEKVGLADKYNRVAAKAAGVGLVGKEDANIEHYVTRKTLDGLYFVIGEEEKKIRQDPAGSGSAILRNVFGVLK